MASALSILITVLALVVAAMVHEVAHGYAAHLCGDDTAKEAGRLSLNPARHLDPVGSLILPLVMASLGGIVFAYAKPVPYNPWRLRHRRRDEVIVALAGPASNLLQALVGAALFRIGWEVVSQSPELLVAPSVFGYGLAQLVLLLLSSYVSVNAMLLFFNLIPLPPLDGSKVVCFFLKGQALERYYEVQRYAMPILLIALYVVPMALHVNPLGIYLDHTAWALTDLLLGA